MSQKEIIQKYFTIVVEGLRKQGWKQCIAEKRDGCVTQEVCAWSNGVPGMHCAIGHLIPKDRISEIPLRGQNTFSAYSWKLYPKDLLEEMDKTADIQLDYLKVWQTMHDGGDSPEQMENQFRWFAKKKGLSWPEETVP